MRQSDEETQQSLVQGALENLGEEASHMSDDDEKQSTKYSKPPLDC